MTTYAKIVCDSVSPLGVRLTSIEVQFPRFILPQVLMHRQWSRSCESMRARPTKSKLNEVKNAPFVPTFGQNQKGMVAGPELGVAEQRIARGAWTDALRACQRAAEELADLGVAKQWANRLLEPFAYQKVLVTATDFGNFFRLRCADDAQPEVQELATYMRNALFNSDPVRRTLHLPYVDDQTVWNWAGPAVGVKDISAARCARVSYTTHDGKRDVEADRALARTLLTEAHSNPFEHQATPAPDNRRYANLKGWVSYRYQLEQDGTLPNPEG